VFENDGFEGLVRIVRGDGAKYVVQADPLVREEATSRVGGDTQVGALGRGVGSVRSDVIVQCSGGCRGKFWGGGFLDDTEGVWHL